MTFDAGLLAVFPFQSQPRELLMGPIPAAEPLPLEGLAGLVASLAVARKLCAAEAMGVFVAALAIAG